MIALDNWPSPESVEQALSEVLRDLGLGDLIIEPSTCVEDAWVISHPPVVDPNAPIGSVAHNTSSANPIPLVSCHIDDVLLFSFSAEYTHHITDWLINELVVGVVDILGGNVQSDDDIQPHQQYGSYHRYCVMERSLGHTPAIIAAKLTEEAADIVKKYPALAAVYPDNILPAT